MKKLISILLLISMCVGMISCANSDEGNAENTSPVDTGDGEKNIVDRLGHLDYGEEEFNVLCWGSGAGQAFGSNYYCNDLYVEETSDGISQAIYRRQVYVEELLKVKITPTYMTNATTAFQTGVQSGDDSYDMAMLIIRDGGVDAFDLSLQNLLYNLKDLEYVDLNGEYWDKQAVEAFTVNNKCFIGVGDITLADELLAGAMLYNKKMAEDFKIGDIYALVHEGGWTIDKLIEMMTNVGADLNNDSIYDANDRFGYLGEERTLDQMWFASGETMTHKKPDGSMYVDLIGDRSMEVIDKVWSLMNENANFGYWTRIESSASTANYELFTADRVLFQGTTMRPITQLRSKDVEYGIIPYPKYDEDQEQYYTYQNPGACISAVVPVTAPNKEMSGAVMEALAHYGKQELYPAIYEVLFQYKVAQDFESQRMIDLIYGCRVWDLAFAADCGNIYTFLSQNVLITGNISSSYAKLKIRVDKDFKDLIKIYNSN